MIVDDEENILSSLKRVLGRSKNIEIETFISATDALKRAQIANFELFISDYRMPEMDGIQFLVETKELQPESMRIMLSGHADLDSVLSAVNHAEIYRFICKPWIEYELIATVKQALDYRDIQLENRILADQIRQQQEELERLK